MGPEASKVRRVRSLLVHFQLGQLRLRDKETGQVPPEPEAEPGWGLGPQTHSPWASPLPGI